MKYEKKMLEVLRECLYEEGMTEQEYQEKLKVFQSFPRTNMKEMHEDIEIGIKNGYSFEKQIEMIKRICKIQL